MLLLYALTSIGLPVQTGNEIIRALSSPKPLVVHIWDPFPSELNKMDVNELSMICRDAGAAAVLIPDALISDFAEEQASARGDFPGPVPLIVDCCLETLAYELGLDGVCRDLEPGKGPADLVAWKLLGAAAIGLR